MKKKKYRKYQWYELNGPTQVMEVTGGCIFRSRVCDVYGNAVSAVFVPGETLNKVFGAQEKDLISQGWLNT